MPTEETEKPISSPRREMWTSRSSLRSISSEADLPRSSAEMQVPIHARIDQTIVRTIDAPMAMRSGHW